MNSFFKFIKLSLTGFSFGRYYENLNWALKKLNNEFIMLHYPMYKNKSDSFLLCKCQIVYLFTAS